MIKNKPIARAGMITANASDILGLMTIAITNAKISMKGQRTAVLIIIM